MRLYSVRDRKAGTFGQPFALRNDTVAIREFGAAIEDEKSVYRRHLEDFELCDIAEFGEDEEVPIIACEPRVVITAKAYAEARNLIPKEV